MKHAHITPAQTTPPDGGRNTVGKKPKKLWRVFKWISAIILLPATVFAGIVLWLVTTESGLRYSLHNIPAWFGVNISSKTLNGTLRKGFSGENLHIETKGTVINISHFALTWYPQKLIHKKLHIKHLAMGNIRIDTKPTASAEKTPPATGLPSSINLPIEVVLDSLTADAVSIGSYRSDKQTVYISYLNASYTYNRQQHNLKLHNAQTPLGNTYGSASLNQEQPFALNADVYSRGVFDKQTINTKARLQGNLQNLKADIFLNGDHTHLQATSVLHPFAEKPNNKINLIQVKGSNINPQALLNSLPKALLEFDAAFTPSLEPDTLLEGNISLSNQHAAAVDNGGIPVNSLSGSFTINKTGLIGIREITAKLMQKGKVVINGNIDTEKQQLVLNTALHNVSTANFFKHTAAAQLYGSITLNGPFRDIATDWKLNAGHTHSNGLLHIQTDTDSRQTTLLLKNARITPENGGEISAKGLLELFGSQILQLSVDSKNFNPEKLNKQFPHGSVSGRVNLNGELANQKYSSKIQLDSSMLSGAPLNGNADIVYEKKRFPLAAAHIVLGKNSIKANGSFGQAGSRLNININAPDLSLFGFGMHGLLNASGYITGNTEKLEADLVGQADNLRIGNIIQASTLNLKLQGSPDYALPLNIEITGKQISMNIAGNPTLINTVNLSASGTGKAHRIHGSGNLLFQGNPYKFNLRANGGLNDIYRWKGIINTLDIGGSFNLNLQNNMNLEAASGHIAMGAAQWRTMGGKLNIEHFAWNKKNGFTTKGNADNLHIAQLHKFYTPPIQHNLIIAGNWDLSYNQYADGYLNIRRQGGDITLTDRKQILGLNSLSLHTRFQDNHIISSLNGVTNYGKLESSLVITPQSGGSILQAGISGSASIDIANLERLRNFLPIGQKLSGSLTGTTAISGYVGNPQFNGILNGNKLHYRHQDLGLILDNGTLQSRIQEQTWIIDDLHFHRNNGSANLKGLVHLNNAKPDVDVDIAFNQYDALEKANRRLKLSGDTKVHYNQANGIAVAGTLKVDSGRFGFQKSAMPELDEDVVILGSKLRKTNTIAVNVNLDLDLNNNLQFIANGLDVTLGGKLNISTKNDITQSIGTVNVVKGRYKAYGQDLDITKGQISFVGPLSNPNLNIHAERRLSPVGVGVEVLGNLNKPRIILVTNEAMSEKDKLSWLIFNRASSGSNDEAALSAAAVAFLAGNINDRLKLLDDFGLVDRRRRNAQTGELNPTEQVLTIGKQLTNNLYLGYEHSLNNTAQSVSLIYRFSRTLQAAIRIGNVSSNGEVTYSVRFDSLGGKKPTTAAE